MLPQAGSGLYRVLALSQAYRPLPVVALLFVVTLFLAACGGAAATRGEVDYGRSSTHERGDGRGTGAAVSSASWIGPLVKVNGTIYLLSKEPPVEPDRLGDVVAQVERMLDGKGDVRDGDSNFLPEGTKIYSIQGMDVAEAVAVSYQGRYVVLKPNLSPGEIGTVK